MTKFCIEIYKRDQPQAAIGAVFIREAGHSMWSYIGATVPFYGPEADGRAMNEAEKSVDAAARLRKIGHDYEIVEKR